MVPALFLFLFGIASAPAQSPAILLDIKSPATASPPSESLLTLDDAGDLWIKGQLYDYPFQSTITLDPAKKYWTLRDATGKIIWALEVHNPATGISTGNLYSIGSFQGWMTNPSQSGDPLRFANAAGNTVFAVNASGNAGANGSVPARSSAPPYEIPTPPAQLPVNPPPDPINLSVIDPDLDGLIIPWPQSQGRVYWGDIPGNLYEDVTDASWRYPWRSSLKTLAEYSIFRGLRYQTNPGGNPVLYGKSVESSQNPGVVLEWDGLVSVNGGVVSLLYPDYGFGDSNWSLSALPALPASRPADLIPISITMTNPEVLPIPPYYYGSNSDDSTSATSRLYLYNFEFEHPDPSLIPQKAGDASVAIGCCLNPRDVPTTWTNHVELTLWDQFPPGYYRTFVSLASSGGGQIWISEMWDGKLYETGVPDGNPVYSASGDVLMFAKVVWNVSSPAKLWEQGEWTFWEPYIIPDILVDSNNNGYANSQDGPVEMDAPGKLIYLNQDDDNQDDTPDKDINTTITLNENDLAPIYLDYEALESTGTLTLECPGNTIRFWLNSTKGTSPYTLPLPWPINGTGNDWYCLYMEGINPGKVEITLTAKDPTGKILGRDRVKVGVVGIEFTTSTLTAYGWDDGTKTTSPTVHLSDRLNPDVNVNSREDFTLQTHLTATITPGNLAPYVHFKSFADGGVGLYSSISPAQAAGSPQDLTITAYMGQSGLDSVTCRLGSTNGAQGPCLGVHTYLMARLYADLQVTSYTGLLPAKWPTQSEILGTNEYLKTGVAKLLECADNGLQLLTESYDDVTTTSRNGRLDIFTGQGVSNPERDSLTDQFLPEYKDPQDPGMGYIIRIICVKNSILYHWPDGSTSNCAGVNSTTHIFLTDNIDNYPEVAAHELGHSLSLKDIGPENYNTANLMYFQGDGSLGFLGYFPVARTRRPGESGGLDYQWDWANRP